MCSSRTNSNGIKNIFSLSIQYKENLSEIKSHGANRKGREIARFINKPQITVFGHEN